MTFKIWGTESTINPQINLDRDAVTMLPNGGYVVTWRESQKIAFQLYDGNGSKVGGEHFVAGSTFSQHSPDVLAVGSDGRFVIAWTETNATDSRTLRTEQFGNDGVSVGAATVSTTVAHDGVQLSHNGLGGWSISYVDQTAPGNVMLAHYGADGSAGGAIVLPTANGLNLTDSAWLGGTKHLVSYTNGGAGGSSFRMIDGANVSALFEEAGIQDIRVVALKNESGPNGGYALLLDKGAAGLDAIMHGANGDEHTVSIAGAKPNATFETFNATALKNGGIAVAYVAEDAGDFGDVFVKVIDASGTAGPALKVNMRASVDGPGRQLSPSISETADGRLAVTWHDPTLGTSIVSTTYVDARTSQVTVQGTSHDDVYAPSEFTGDYLDGGAGIDTLTFHGASSRVAVNLAAHSGTVGDAVGDTYVNFERLIGSKFADTLVGDGAANRLQGGAGNDTVKGGAGNDQIGGGAGVDKLYGGTGSQSRDAFLFDVSLTSASVANRNKDTIYDFGSKYDSLQFDHAAFTNRTIASYINSHHGASPDHALKMSGAFVRLGTHALDRNDFFIYNAANHKLYWDADGSGSRAQVEIATINLERHAGSVSASDFFFV